MSASPDTSLQVVTGGRENELKVWDGNNPVTPTFQAKNVRTGLAGNHFSSAVFVWSVG